MENVIKIYIIKILYNLNNRNFEKLFKYDLILRNEFKKIQIKNTQYFLINYFVPLDENDKKEFDHGNAVYFAMTDKNKKETNEEKKNLKENKEEISIYSNENEIHNIDIFLSITINKLISN